MDLKWLLGRQNGLKRELIKGGAAGLSVRLLAMLASMGSSIALARVLGSTEYGIYAFVFSAITILTMPVQMGLPTLVVRETAQAAGLENWPLVRGIWRWSSRIILAGSAVMIGLILGILWLFEESISPERHQAFLWALPLIPLLAFARVRNSALRGLRHVFWGPFPDRVLRPVLVGGGVIAGGYLLALPTDAITALGIHSVAAGIAFLMGTLLLARLSPDPLVQTHTTESRQSEWLRSIIPLSLIAGLQIISQNTDLVMLGIMRSDEDVGHYRVAVSVATLVIFGLTAVNLTLQPYFSRFFAFKDMRRLQQLASASALAALLVTVPVVLLFVIAGRPLIAFVFGSGYSESYYPLLILATGQAVSAFFGSVGALLTMSGHEHESARALATSATVNVALNAILIPTYGTIGAAMATAGSVVLWNLLFWRSAMRILGISSTPFHVRKGA